MKSKSIISLLLLLPIAISAVPALANANSQIKSGSAIGKSTKIARNPLNDWMLISPKQDLGENASPKEIADWNRIAILSKPYREDSLGEKRFKFWRFISPKQDLGENYTLQQKRDWILLRFLTGPYRTY